MAGNSFFEQLNARTGSNYGRLGTAEERLAAIEELLNVGKNPLSPYATATEEAEVQKDKPAAGTPLTDPFGFPTGKEQLPGGVIRSGKNLGLEAVGEAERAREFEKGQAQDYVNYLTNQIRTGRLTAPEAESEYATYGMAYQIPGTFQTASELGKVTQGLPSKESVERYRPFQQYAAKKLGINLTDEDITSTEEVARSLGKTTPEAFSEFLGQSLLSDPRYIRKTPLALTANLPFGGRYGIGYQTPEGTFTGTYRFKPPSTVKYT